MNRKLILLITIIMGLMLACSGGSADDTPGPTPPEKPIEPTDPTDPDEHKPVCYFVATNGNDANDGTIDKPIKTINIAINMTKEGDTVYVREGVYNQKVVIQQKGTAKKHISIKAYKGEKPVISGEGIAVTSSTALILVSEAKFVNVEGFEVRNLITNTPWTEANGITVNAGSSSINIKNNHVHHIQSQVLLTEGRGAHAILVIGNTPNALRDIVVEGNTIHDCSTGYSENLTINGYVDGFTVKGNTIYDCENIGIVAAGGYAGNPNPDLNYVRNGLICENVVYNMKHDNGPIPLDGAIGIYVDGARSITVDRNRVFDCDRGIGVVSETDNFPTKDCIVRNNVVYDCQRTGIYMGGYLGYTGGGSQGCYIVNNTLYGNDKIAGHFGEVEGEIRLTENCTNNYIYNNLVCSTIANDLFVHKYTATGSNNAINNNHYSGPGGWMWQYQDENRITDFAAYKSASGIDANSIYTAQPFFTGLKLDANTNFSIPSGSAAKNGGKYVNAYTHGTLDFNGKPRAENGRISIGAYQ